MRWPLRRFGDVADFRNGLNFVSTDRGGDLAIVGVEDFSNPRLTDAHSLHTVRWPHELSEHALIKSGDLLFVRSNGSKALVGRCMLVESVERPTTHSGFTIRARIQHNDVAAKWVFAFFESGLAKRALGLGIAGTNISNLSQGVLRRLELPVPPIDVQLRYVSLFDRVEIFLERIEAIIRLKRDLKRGLMQEVLTGQRRFSKFRLSDWQEKPLAQFFAETNRRNIDHEVDTILSCSKLYGVIPQAKRFKKRIASKDIGRYKVVTPGDLVYDPMLLWDASIGFAGEVGVVSPAYATFHFDESKGDRSFFTELLFSHTMRHTYRVISRGTNVRRKKAIPSDFLKIKVTVPASRVEQGAIGGLFAKVNNEIRLYESLRKMCEGRKRALFESLANA